MPDTPKPAPVPGQHPHPTPTVVATKATAAPDAKVPEKPDAILCPSTYPEQRGNVDRHVLLRQEFAPVLGSSLIYARSPDPGRAHTFITATAEDAKGRGIARYLGPHHVHAGRDRYTWVDRGDGILYGTLTAEAIADEREA